MLRKLALTGFVLLIGETHDSGRALFAMLLSLLFFACIWAIQPYKRSTDNWLSVIIQLCLTLIYMCILLLKVCQTSASACSTLGFGNDGSGIFLLFLVFTFFVLLSLVLLGALHLVRESAAATGELHLRATDSVPELSAAHGITYHLFLSHIWGTGQDQVLSALSSRAQSFPNRLCTHLLQLVPTLD
uniref:Uncharacterized protein n=1 Tax=Coccolithus braarudii TaxID=221442 RepID=A0A7S0PW36_9EUKA|mmetsp:Transcript_18511/g.39858  ORF Transcript_18511/g.39858 Transcript_18511/m.39858 type:complete len:187 (+) Transcript_18511:358-918(+)